MEKINKNSDKIGYQDNQIALKKEEIRPYQLCTSFSIYNFIR